MSVKKRLIYQTKKYEQYKEYTDKLQQQKISQQDQSVIPFDLGASVAQDILLKNEAKRKARNKRKAAKRN